jgi:preprotein translocase subunit YajC
MYDRFMPLAQLNMGSSSAPAVEPRAAVAPAAAATGTNAVPVAASAPAVATTATTESASTQPGLNGKPAAGPLDGLMSFAPIIVMLIVLYFFMSRGPKKEEKRRKQMLSELKKGDKVMTTGGLIARVVAVDGDEVTLKIDESANVKATYSKSSIHVVINGDEKVK